MKLRCGNNMHGCILNVIAHFCQKSEVAIVVKHLKIKQTLFVAAYCKRIMCKPWHTKVIWIEMKIWFKLTEIRNFISPFKREGRFIANTRMHLAATFFLHEILKSIRMEMSKKSVFQIEFRSHAFAAWSTDDNEVTIVTYSSQKIKMDAKLHKMLKNALYIHCIPGLVNVTYIRH